MKKSTNTYSQKLSSTDIAQKAGVSQATVSRVLSGGARVSEKTRARVMRIVDEYGYQPDPFAQSMRTRQSGVVGVAVSRITNPIVPEILEALAARFTALGRRMVVWNTDSDGVTGPIDAIRRGTVDGLVFTAASHQSDAMHAALDRGVPVVSLNRYLEGADCDQVVSANFDGARQLAQYLVHHDRRRIAFVNGPLDRTTLVDRAAGFQAGLTELGREIMPGMNVWGRFSDDLFRDLAREMASGPERPDAIACGNDLVAIGVLNGLRSLGVSVPQDIWVTGFDGIAMTAWDIVDLTTMRQPLEDMASDAAEALVSRIEGRSGKPRMIQYRAELVVRGSTAHASALTQETS